MLYFMNGKTLITKYLVDRTPDEILQTQFVIVSGDIVKGAFSKDEEILKNKVIVASSLYPDIAMICDNKDYLSTDYAESCKEKFARSKPMLATIIKAQYEYDCDIVFVCGYAERKYKYLQILAEYIHDEFPGCVLYDYKKTGPLKRKSNKVSDRDIDLIDLCDKCIDSVKEKNLKNLMKTKAGRRRWVQGLSKKQLKKELKKRDEYYSDMDVGEMARKLAELLEDEY